MGLGFGLVLIVAFVGFFIIWHYRKMPQHYFHPKHTPTTPTKAYCTSNIDANLQDRTNTKKSMPTRGDSN
jgi:hypothetical protein